MPQRYDHGHPVDEERQCKAETKQGRRCKNPPLVGKTFCAIHGGEAAKYNRGGIFEMGRAEMERRRSDGND